MLAARTVNIAPTAFAPAAAPKLSDQQRVLVANAVGRAMCIALSDRFNVVGIDAPADLTVRTVVTHVTETDEVAAGLSAAASIGTKFVDFGVPVPVPRLPIGLGSLTVEAEAVDRKGRQQAAMVCEPRRERAVQFAEDLQGERRSMTSRRISATTSASC